MTSLVISENGRILIPSALREELGSKPNGKIYVEVKDGTLVLIPAAQRSDKLRAYFDKHLKPLGVEGAEGSVDEFIAERRKQAKLEDKE
jgi:AbrB family looped-hinge helix DNA binding protein